MRALTRNGLRCLFVFVNFFCAEEQDHQARGEETPETGGYEEEVKLFFSKINILIGSMPLSWLLRRFGCT